MRYKDTLEVLHMDHYDPSRAASQFRYGASGILDCLEDLHQLRYLKPSLHSLSGVELGLAPESDDCEVTWVMAPYTLEPMYEAVKALALTSSSLYYAGQRAIYHTVIIRSTST